MIAFESALRHVLSHTRSLGSEVLPLSDATGRYLAEEVVSDRDFPPFDRVTMDGYAIAFGAWLKGQIQFTISGMARAGYPEIGLAEDRLCVEVTTGAVLPNGCDTVIPYEQTERVGNTIKIRTPPTLGQNIHRKGSDILRNSVLLEIGKPLSAVEIAVLATVGKSKVRVKKAPKVVVLATGDELIPVTEIPEPHQIRMSNSHMIAAALQKLHINPELIHISDDPHLLETGLTDLIKNADALILSGGVSMGPYDFLPKTLKSLEVEQIFHRVAQKPGKPLWFGSWKQGKCLVFALPGNPVSSFLNYLLYFQAWVMACWNIPVTAQFVELETPIENKSLLTQFIPVQISLKEGLIRATPISNNGSGDFFSLTRAHGFIRLQPETNYLVAAHVQFTPYRPIFS